MKQPNIAQLIRSLFNSSCYLCMAQADTLDICLPCQDDLPHLTTSCTQCAEPLPHVALCGRCLKEPPAFDHVYCPYLYEAPVDFLVKALKYNNQQFLGRTLGTLMARQIIHDAIALPDYIIPMPLHISRLRSRGYNQAELIAQNLAQHLSLPLKTDLLQRTQHTTPQSQLSAIERKQNIQQAFFTQMSCADQHIAIIDDVVTTTSTARSAAHALKDAGARRVDIWGFSRAAAL